MSPLPNKEEQLIIDSLKHQSFTDIKFEPDGNIPPDIVLNGTIAIEVRRLNENYIADNRLKSYNEDTYILTSKVTKVIHKIADAQFDKSALIAIRFSRPYPIWKDLMKLISIKLKEHKKVIAQRAEYEIAENVIMDILPSEKVLPHQYNLAFVTDLDQGGFVLHQIHENLNFVMKEKEAKIAKYKDKYSEWWLAVSDNIGHGFREIELDQFKKSFNLNGDFNKILIVSPSDAANFLYLP